MSDKGTSEEENMCVRTVVDENEIINPIPWPDPSPEDLRSSEFEAIWQTIKTWDISVPEAYVGYDGASGNHAKAILDALRQSNGAVLSDGSAFEVVSLPLPDDHWLFAELESGYEEPPAPMRIGTDDPRRAEMKQKLQMAAQYAIRAATSNGKLLDFDPDALIQNLVIGFLGYNTSDG